MLCWQVYASLVLFCAYRLLWCLLCWTCSFLPMLDAGMSLAAPRQKTQKTCTTWRASSRKHLNVSLCLPNNWRWFNMSSSVWMCLKSSNRHRWSECDWIHSLVSDRRLWVAQRIWDSTWTVLRWLQHTRHEEGAKDISHFLQVHVRVHKIEIYVDFYWFHPAITIKNDDHCSDKLQRHIRSQLVLFRLIPEIPIKSWEVWILQSVVKEKKKVW